MPWKGNGDIRVKGLPFPRGDVPGLPRILGTDAEGRWVGHVVTEPCATIYFGTGRAGKETDLTGGGCRARGRGRGRRNFGEHPIGTQDPIRGNPSSDFRGVTEVTGDVEIVKSFRGGSTKADRKSSEVLR